MECRCCGSHRQATASLRRNRVRRGGTRALAARAGSSPPDAIAGTESIDHALCESCLRWLAGVVGDLHAAEPPSGRGGGGALLGAPLARQRVRIFADQCHLCRELVGASAVIVDSRLAGGGEGPLAAMLVCGACDAWVGGLADDGRSARGTAVRAIDGAYGAWPHPNLSALTVQLGIADAELESAIRAACRQMGVRVSDALEREAVAIIEAGADGEATAFVRDDGGRQGGRIVLASLGSEADLRTCLELGISTWLTNPVTPQQLSAAMTTIAHRPGLALRWDPETALPRLELAALRRPALAIAPVAGVSWFEAAWFTKRVSRGYDDAGTAGGVIVLVPRAPESDMVRVEARLARALAGRCTVEALTAPLPRPRLEAAG